MEKIYTLDLIKDAINLILKKFITKILENKKVTYVYAHNFSGFMEY
jgi:hypothetical protein